MADIVSPEDRSKTMRAVGSRNTSIELKLRKALWHQGLRYRVEPEIEGVKPDIAFLGSKVAVFADGCFWHGCPKCYTEPDNNKNYWRDKLKSNRERDARDTRDLESCGWTVLRFWGCEIRQSLEKVVTVIEEEL